ncbi:FAD-dependent monooxygenase [Microbispora sp. NPDC049125]|uniref:FAD-dependent monooxygenase n=1 Tax=Microbispora sp. NPDC049125 TaxID=3154929 RepID=UPI003465817A
MNQRTVLISGAGIAGPTLAYWLARHGFHVTVVERAAALRSSGSPVDVRGPAVGVADRMGVMPRLREAATRVTGITLVDGRGRRVGRVDTRALRRATGSREVEIPRGDLATILFEAARDDVELLLGDSIATLSQDPEGVDVTFERAAPRRFDLVVGADGLHSTVRRLAFGPEQDFVRHMGLYVATLPLDGSAGHGQEMVMYNTPGRAVAVHPSHGGVAAFMYRSPQVPDFRHGDVEQHKRLLAAAYASAAWRVPELLARVREADELYFDSVSKATVRQWWNGRVALLGDASSCVSLFGDGSTLAMAGAFTLAAEMGAAPDDHESAFRRYQTRHSVLTEPKQQNVTRGAALLIPATWRGIAARNLATRLWPLAAAAGWAGRRLTPRRDDVADAQAL